MVNYPVPTVQGFMLANRPRRAYLLAMHCISAHCNIAAVHSSWKDNFEYHWAEHTGPGGIRNHHYADLSFDKEKIEEVLGEAEQEEDRGCDGLLPVRFTQVLLRRGPAGLLQPFSAAMLAEDNWRQVILWLKSAGVHATWNANPPRLFFGGRLGSYAIPPGWLVVLRDGAAEAHENGSWDWEWQSAT